MNRPHRLTTTVFGLLIATVALGSEQVFYARRATMDLQVGHAAIAVSSIEAAQAWYGQVFGFRSLSEPIVIDRVQNPDAPLSKIAGVLFGNDVRTMRFSKMKLPQGPSIELFEFHTTGAEGRPKRAGWLHLALISSNVEGLSRSIMEHGGTLLVRADPTSASPVAFCTDPDGNILEIASSGWKDLPSSPPLSLR